MCVCVGRCVDVCVCVCVCLCREMYWVKGGQNVTNHCWKKE